MHHSTTAAIYPLSLHDALPISKVQRVTIVDDADRVMEVVVEDKQLSLAIGKKGQNVRLAAKLTGTSITRSARSEEHTSELQSLAYLVCRLLLEKKKLLAASSDR